MKNNLHKVVRFEGYMPGDLENHITKLLKTEVVGLPEIIRYFKPVSAARKQNLLTEGKVQKSSHRPSIFRRL